MTATDIQWEVDTKEELVNLPEEIEIPDWVDINDPDEVSNYISEVTGYCHKGYILES